MIAAAALVVAAALLADAEAIRALSDAGRNAEAAAAARALVEEREARYGDRSPSVAEALELEVLARARLHQGDPAGKDERLALAERALAIRLATAGPDDVEVAGAWYAVGLVYNLAGDPAAAVGPFGKARAIVERRYGELHPDTARFVREHGAALFGAGRVAEAAELFDRHLAIARTAYGRGDPATFPALYNAAIARQQLGRLDEAQELLAEASAALAGDSGADAVLRLQVRSQEALLQTLRGELGASVRTFEEVYATARAEIGAAEPLTAALANNLGYALLDFGDARRALEVLEPVLAREPAHALPPLQELRLRMNLARALRASGRGAEARAAFAEARRVGLQALAPEEAIWGEFHVHFGGLLDELGLWEEAREQFAQALERLDPAAGAPPLDAAEALSGAGRVDLRLGRPDRARERLQRALDLIEEVAGTSHRWFAVREELAEAYWALGERERAFDQALAAARASVDYDRATLAALAERQARVRTGRRRAARDVAVSALFASPAPAPAAWRREAFDLTVRARALVFDEMAARRAPWFGAADPAVAARVAAWGRARTRLADLFVLGPRAGDGDWAARLAGARREVERLESGLAASSASYRARRREDAAGFDAVRATLRADEALVSFLRHGRLGPGGSGGSGAGGSVDSYAAIVLRPGAEAPDWIDLGPAGPLERAIADWRTRCDPDGANQAGVAAYRATAAILRRLLWDPVAARLGDARRVHVVPDGPLHAVAFAALPAAEGGYLLERGPTFRYLTAERDLLRDDAGAGAAPAARGAGLLLVSDPAFGEAVSTYRGDDPECAGLSAERFGPLPGTRAEARAVRRVWSDAVGEPVEALDGPRAAETAVKARLSGRRALHLATHGYFLDAGCGATATGTAARTRGIGGLASAGPVETAEPAGPAVARDNPLLLSGLVLAGAGSGAGATDDGFLTAEEVSALDLTGTELAVLSACRTGAGRASDGEGLFGLRRAFLLAGAGSVVSSLWDVDDRSARVWIERLYRGRFVDGLDPADAVRAASLHVLETRRAAGLDDHPFHWAGWIAAGR